ncbi:unnamed protein product [Diamesa tonsa]
MPKVQLYEARICHVVKRDDFDGYGFNLHAEKGRPGQYIGKVDEGSPAESAGLRQGDRIIDVNAINIGSETHKQVVERIKSVPNQTRLLVIDPPTLTSSDETTTTITTTTTSMDDSIKSTNSNGTSTPGILNLHMTAAEMRAQLKSKKRIDPKMDSLDVRKKYEAIQKL